MPEPEPTAIQAVLIDLDDTILPWQTLAHWQWAWRPLGPVLSERHVHAALRRSMHRWDRRRWEAVTGAAPPVDDAAYRGFLAWTLGEIAGHPLSSDESKAVVERFLRPMYEPERFDDALPLLEALRRRGLPVGILSGLPPEASRFALKRAGLPEALLVPPTEAALPGPAAFRSAAAHLKVKPRSTLLVGDLFWSDVRAASRAGLIGVLLDRAGAAARTTGTKVRSLAQVPELLDRPSVEPPAASDDGPDPAGP